MLDQVRSITVPLYSNPMWEAVEYRAVAIQYPTLFGVGPHGHVIFNPNQRMELRDLLTERLVLIEPKEGVLELDEASEMSLGKVPSWMIGHCTYADKTKKKDIEMRLWAPALEQESSTSLVVTRHHIQFSPAHIASILPVIAIIP